MASSFQKKLDVTYLQVTQGYLKGGQNSASAIELIKFKKKCFDYLLDVEMHRQGFCPQDLTLLRSKMSDHKSFRKNVAPLEGTPMNGWQASLKQSSMLCLKLLEERPNFDLKAKTVL